MKGSDVRPAKWSKIIDLYDDGDNSYIWGYYNGDSKPCLAFRYNYSDNDDIGYPRQGNNPVWCVLPKHIWLSTLLTLRGCKYSNDKNIRTAILELLWWG